MRIPYVIDNEEHRLADVLNQVLAEHAGRSLDVASAYFTVGGYAQVRERIAALGSFRLLLGAEPAHGADIDLKGRTIVDNRYLIANLIQCEPAAPRVVEPGALSGVFATQEEVVADILKSVAKQKALEVAPRTIDLVQQTVATAIQGYLNHPELDRKEAIDLIRFLNQPMMSVQIKGLRVTLKNYKSAGQVKQLIEEVRKLRAMVAEPETASYGTSGSSALRREELRLICFEFLSGG